MFIINGTEVDIGLQTCVNYKTNPSLRIKMGEDGHTKRRGKVKSIIVHTTNGLYPQVILPGKGPVGKSAENNVKYWTGNSGNAGAHLLIDYDATWIQTADLITETTYHACDINEYSIGIEIVARTKKMAKGSVSEVYEEQLEKCADLCCFLLNLSNLYPQTQFPYNKNAIPRLKKGNDTVGVFCHFHQTTNRGPGDCGEEFFKRLYSRGFKKWDFSNTSDLEYWKSQGVADGIPGPTTCVALKNKGLYPNLLLKNGHVYFEEKS